MLAEAAVARHLSTARRTPQAAGAGADLIASLGMDSLRNEITGYCQLADRVIDQSRRRVLQGEQVPTEEKIST